VPEGDIPAPNRHDIALEWVGSATKSPKSGATGGNVETGVLNKRHADVRSRLCFAEPGRVVRSRNLISLSDGRNVLVIFSLLRLTCFAMSIRRSR
jgi:hypothetical protein